MKKKIQKQKKSQISKQKYIYFLIGIIILIGIFFTSRKPSIKKPLNINEVGNPTTGIVTLSLNPATSTVTPGTTTTLTLNAAKSGKSMVAIEAYLTYSASCGTPVVEIAPTSTLTAQLMTPTVGSGIIHMAYGSLSATADLTADGPIALIKVTPSAGTCVIAFDERTYTGDTESTGNTLKSASGASITAQDTGETASPSTASSASPSTTASPTSTSTSSPTATPSITPQKPAKPTGLRSNCYDGGNKITLRWDTVSGVTNYKVRMDQKDGPNDISVDNLTKAEYDAGIKPDQKYSWWVHSSKDGLDSEEAKIDEVICAKPTATPTPTATPKATIKASATQTPKATPKTTHKATPQSTTKAAVTTSTPSPSTIGSLNDIFGQKPQEESETPSSDAGLLTKIALGWQAIFLKLAELFQ